MSLDRRPAGIYVHVPFCSAVCPYCDFAVIPGRRERRARFVESLVAETRLYQSERGDRGEHDTIYLGGGTPSLLEPAQIGRILEALRQALDIRADAWIHLEANPEDITAARAAAWRALGVRTLSIGVQSLDAEALAFLGRRHSPEQARRAVLLARETGFDTISLDLIYALPGDQEARLRREIAAFLDLAPDHLSCYELSMPEGTPFGRRRQAGQLQELGEERRADLFLLAHDILYTAGFEHYEVSNFAARAEHRSRHNQKYWDHSPYRGFGPSAHSFDRGRRSWNERSLGRWEARVAEGVVPVAGSEQLGERELLLESLMLGLRTADGIDLSRLEERFAVDLDRRNRALIDSLTGDGLLERVERTLRPTPRGLAVADSLARSFEAA